MVPSLAPCIKQSSEHHWECFVSTKPGVTGVHGTWPQNITSLCHMVETYNTEHKKNKIPGSKSTWLRCLPCILLTWFSLIVPTTNKHSQGLPLSTGPAITPENLLNTQIFTLTQNNVFYKDTVFFL